MRSYETDYAGWAEDTARAIQEGRWGEIDRAALADEVGSSAGPSIEAEISAGESLSPLGVDDSRTTGEALQAVP